MLVLGTDPLLKDSHGQTPMDLMQTSSAIDTVQSHLDNLNMNNKTKTTKRKMGQQVLDDKIEGEGGAGDGVPKRKRARRQVPARSKTGRGEWGNQSKNQQKPTLLRVLE